MNIPGLWICRELWICLGCECARFIIWWKEVSVGASYINFWNWNLFIYLFIYFFQCFLNKLLFHGISFYKIVCNVIIFPNTIYKYFSFRLTFHKPHPKFKPISKIWCITKSPVAHIIRSDWKKEYLKKSPYFYSV